MNITNREYFRAIAGFRRHGELFATEQIWTDTLTRWIEQGAPEQLMSGAADIYGNPFSRDYFKHYNKLVISDIKSGWAGGGAMDTGHGVDGLGGSPLVPEFERRIVAEDTHTLTTINGAGQTVKIIKDKFAMPVFINWPVKDWDSWNALKKRLEPDNPERWPADWDSYVKRLNEQDDPVVLQVGGFYGHPRDWVGSENILYMFHDNPDLIEDMMEQLLYLETEIVKRVVKDIRVDEAYYYEDMAYKAGPFISPEMIKKFLVPRYKKLNDLLRSHGVEVITVDCDGNIDKLVPLWLEAGINSVWPLEQAAGNDVVAMRKKYGKELILSGAIDKRSLAKGKDAIKAEVISKVPFLLEQGGYFPSVDHTVPPDVSFENYCYYVNLLREVAGLEELSF
jgi:hypothetical protein